MQHAVGFPLGTLASPKGSRRTGASRPFVGRDTELALLVAALPSAATTGARLHVIRGDAGIGKTRLAHELGRIAADRGHRVVWARCWHESGAPPFWPWTQIVRQVCDRRDVTELGPLVLPDARPVDRFELFDATASLLYDAARRRPLVILLDDLHAADPDSLLLLRFVIGHAHDLPLLVVVTVRDEEETTRPLVAERLGALRDLGEEIHLAGLGEDAVRRLIGASAPVATVQAVTGGNPLHIEQVLRTDNESTSGGSQVGLPGLRRALVARLGRLPEAVFDAIAAVAVTEPYGDLATAGRLLGLDSTTMAQRLALAVGSGLVDVEGGRTTHPLVAETVLDVLSPERRCALHLSAAELAEEAGQAARRAHHLRRAGRAFWRDAVEAARDAGAAAAASLAHQDAVAHLLDAIDLVDQYGDDPRQAFEVLYSLAEAVSRAEGRVPAEPWYRRATECAHDVGDPDLIARAAARHGIQYYFGGDFHLTRSEECRRALSLLPPGETEGRVRLLANYASTGLSGPDPSWCHQVACDAVAMARRVGDPSALAIALVAEQVTDLGPSTVSRRLDTAREIVALAEITADHALAVHGRFLLKAALLERGDIRELDAQLIAQRDLVMRIAEPRFERHWMWFRCMRAALDGRPEVVETLATECFAISQELGDPDGVGVYFGQVGVALWLRGRLIDTLPAYRDLMRDEPHEPLWPAVLAWVSLSGGQRDAARGMLEHFTPPERLPSGQHTLLTLFTMADVAAEVGDDDLVERIWDAALPFADHVVPIGLGAACFGVMARPLGRLAMRLGRTDDALALYERALQVAARIGGQPWIIDAQLALANALIDIGHGDEERVLALARQAADTTQRLQLAVFEPAVAALSERLTELGTAATRVVTTSSTAAQPRTSGPRARICVLGGFEVTALDGSAPRWTSRKARSLLKILVARRGAPLSREQLMDLLWPEETPERLANRLSVALTTVRRALDPARSLPAGAIIAAEGDSLRLLRRHADIDVEVFLERVQVALATHRADGPAARSQLREAMAVFTGGALADEPYAAWGVGLHEEANAAAASVLRALAARAIEAGDHFDAADVWRRLLDLDPYDEPAHLGLIAALQAMGAHGQARAARDRYVHQMWSLGIEPTPDD